MTAMTVEAPRDFPAFQNERTRWWIWCAVLGVVIFTGAVRLRLAEVPLERDEGEYAYTGQLMLQGVAPYKEAYFMKLPGTHAMYALGMAIFGQTRGGIHRWLMVVNVTSIVLIFLLGRKLADPLAGLITCAAFGIMSLSVCVFGPIAHATHFVMLFALAGMVVLSKAIESRRGVVYFLSGLLFGLAFLMKQPGALFCIFGALMILWAELRSRPLRWDSVLKRGAMYSCGVALPYLATCFILWRAGVFGRFWLWTVTCVSRYGTAVSLKAGLGNIDYYLAHYLDPSMVLWVLAVGGTMCIYKDREAGTARIFVPALLVFSLMAVCQGLYFRSHYFIMLLPALALGLGVGSSSLRRLILKTGNPAVSPNMPAIAITGTLALVVLGSWRFFFTATPDDVCRRLYYPGEAFIESVQIADYIREHTAADDRIAVFGSEPQIFFYSGRRSATSYIYTYTLLERSPYAKPMQQEMFKQIEDAHPKYVVIVTMPNSFGTRTEAQEQILDRAGKYCRDFYEIDGAVIVPPDKAAEFHWGKEAARVPITAFGFYIFKRKAPVAGNTGMRQRSASQVFLHGGDAADADGGVAGIGTDIGFPMPATLAFLAVGFNDRN